MSYQSVKPAFLGTKIIDPVDLSAIVKYIDWTFFFNAWKLPGKYPGIEKVCDCNFCCEAWLSRFNPEKQEKAKQALAVFKDAQLLLKEYISTRTLVGKAILHFSEAKSADDGILFYSSEKKQSLLYIPLLRQQKPNEKTGYCYSLSDFISPEKDYIGAFAVTIAGAEESAEKFRAAGDDYNALLIMSLADRLAEALSEWLHEQTRKKQWGYAPNENFSVQELRRTPYQGIRPAIGYPALPDQSVIFDLDKLLQLKQIGITLTDNGMMRPKSSICGLYFSHPQAFYFIVEKIGKDQLDEYAEKRESMPENIKKWLGKIAP